MLQQVGYFGSDQFNSKGFYSYKNLNIFREKWEGIRLGIMKWDIKIHE